MLLAPSDQTEIPFCYVRLFAGNIMLWASVCIKYIVVEAYDISCRIK